MYNIFVLNKTSAISVVVTGSLSLHMNKIILKKFSHLFTDILLIKEW